MWLDPGEPDQEKGTWKKVTRDGKPTVRISCPRCGVAATLDPCPTAGHTVYEDGSIQPSVVCPGEGCTFHEYVELRDWKIQ